MPLLSLIRFLNAGREATANVRFTKIKRTANSFEKKNLRRPCQGIDATGFEPATSASRTQRSTKLSHASL